MSSSALKEGQELHYKGFPICPGIAIGKPFFFASVETDVPEFVVSEGEVEGEVDRYYNALRHSQNDILSLRERLKVEGAPEATAILSAHLEMMRDPLMTTRVEEEIRERRKNTEYVFKTVIGEYEKKFNKISDQFFADRVKDFQDISRRIIGHLRRNERRHLGMISSKVVVFAHELTPSDTAEAKSDYIEAFVTRSGALTSHVAIMARARKIPFVSNVDFPDLSISRPPQVIVNGATGDVIVNPTASTLQEYSEQKERFQISVKGLAEYGPLLSETVCGTKIHLFANIETPEEIDFAKKSGAEGVGLFRTEYMVLGGVEFPTEEEQFSIYKSIVEALEGHKAVIRTFDIGGDKFGHFQTNRHEKNPYLGCRGIRLMLNEKERFKTQIRAILRASAFGPTSILFPMISELSELRAAKALVTEVKEELFERGIPFDCNIPIGCMIEVPSAALTSDILLRECDFLSIGTNDLVQYALAVDRGNPQMSYLYNPCHPSILKMIKMVVDEGRKAGKPVSVCGEIAADPKFTALLIGLGVYELSLASVALPAIKNVIRKLQVSDAEILANKALTLSTAEEIDDLLTKWVKST